MRKNIGRRTSSQKIAKMMKSRARKTPTSASSTRLKPRAIHFAARWVVPIPQTINDPTKGMIHRKERMPTTSSPREESLKEAEAEEQDHDGDDPHDDDPGVVLHLPGLPLPQAPTRPNGLEAQRVHRPVDHASIEQVALDGDPHPAPADRVHDPVDRGPIEPVEPARDPVADRPTERVVGVVDPVAHREDPVDEGPAGGARETLRGDPLGLVYRPGEPDGEPGDAGGERLQQVVDGREAAR